MTMIKYTFNRGKVVMHAKLWKFPGGEVGVAMQPLSDMIRVDSVEIMASMTSSDEFMQLIMFLDAVKRQFIGAKIRLSLPYLPYARQDRVCNPGESLSIAVIARILNSYNLDEIRLLDVHSDVSLALINNVTHVTQAMFWANVVKAADVDVLIAPDAGAAKKIYDLHKLGVTTEVVIANKRRDPNGKIVDFTIDHAAIKDKRAMIIDDICDGGATFIEVANACKGVVKSLDLAVTHGIFSRGFDHVKVHFDKVYTSDSVYGDDQETICPDAIVIKTVYIV